MANFHGNSKTYSSLHIWNLDGIQLKANIASEGKLERWPLGKEFGPVNAIVFDGKNRLWVIRPNIRAIQVFDAKDSPPQTVITWSTTENIVDIAYNMMNGIMYLLDAGRNCICELSVDLLPSEPIECVELKQWALSPYNVNSQSRIALRTETLDGIPIAYVTSPKKSGIIRLPLIKNETPLPLNFYWLPDIPGSKKLGAPAGVCVDEIANTLLVADTQEHRVLECILDSKDKTGKSIVTTKLLCGTTEAGSDGDGGPPNRGRLNNPWDVQIYRYADYVDEKLLTRRGIETISSDDTGRLPRCIFVADMGNHRIRKIVQFMNNETLLTLIGDGNDSDEMSPFIFDDNLLKVTARAPRRITISQLGQLAFFSNQSYIITILTPVNVNAITSGLMTVRT